MRGGAGQCQSGVSGSGVPALPWTRSSLSIWAEFLPGLVGEHNLLDPVNECGKPLIEGSVRVLAAPLVKLPAGMFKLGPPAG